MFKNVYIANSKVRAIINPGTREEESHMMGFLNWPEKKLQSSLSQNLRKNSIKTVPYTHSCSPPWKHILQVHIEEGYITLLRFFSDIQKEKQYPEYPGRIRQVNDR